MGNRRLRRLEPIRGRLPPAGRSIGSLEVWKLGGLAFRWGSAPRPGRGGAANAAPENGEQRTENRTRDKRATEKL